MQKIADRTKIVSVCLTQDQYEWILATVGKRQVSAMIRKLVQQEMDLKKENEK